MSARDGADGTDGTDGQDGTNGTDGADGKQQLFIYRSVPRNEIPNTPSGGSFTGGELTAPTGWLKSPTQVNLLERDVYISQAVGNPADGTLTAWSPVARFTGRDGIDGTDGTNGTNGTDGQDGRTRLRIYQVTARGTTPTSPSGGRYLNYDLTLIPPPWTLAIPEVDTATQDLWVTEATGDPNSGAVSGWSIPRRFSGRDGTGGTGSVGPATTSTRGTVLLATDLNDRSDIPNAGQVSDGLANKQDKLPDGTGDQFVGYDDDGNIIAKDAPAGGGGRGTTTPVIRERTFAINQDAATAYQNTGLSLPAGDTFTNDPLAFVFDAPDGANINTTIGVNKSVGTYRAATSANPTEIARITGLAEGSTRIWGYMDENDNLFWVARNLGGVDTAFAGVSLTSVTYFSNTTAELRFVDNLDETGDDDIAPVSVIKAGIDAAAAANTDTFFVDLWVEVPKGTDGSGITFRPLGAGIGVYDQQVSLTAGSRFTTKPQLEAPFNTNNVYDASDLPAGAATSTTHDYYHFVRRYTAGGSIRGPWFATGKWGGGSGGGGTDTNSYPIEAWIEVPKSVETVSASALTSAGDWNNDPAAPAFTTKPTTNVAGGVVRDASDLPDNSTASTTRNYHHFKRIFTVGETGVAASAWDYMGQWNHEAGGADGYLIKAYLELQGTDAATATSLTNGGVWNDTSKSFTTKPGHGTLGTVYGRNDLPAGAATSTTHGYWEYERYYTPGETNVPASAWTLLGRINPAPAAGGASLAWTDLGLSATNTVGEVTVTSTQLTNRVELSVSYGTATANNAGTDDHDANGNNNKVFGTNINLSLIPAYTATNGWVQFGGFGRGANQFIIQAKRTSDGGLTLEGVDNNTNSNVAIYAVFAR